MMIRLLLLYGMLQAISFVGVAQERKTIQLDVGLSAGYSKAEFFGGNIDNRVDPGYSPDNEFIGHKGPTASFQVKMTVWDYFFLRQYITYIEKGAEETDTRFSYEATAQVNYMAFPLMIGFQPINLGNAEWLNVYVEGGMAPNFMTKLDSDEIKKGYAQAPYIRDVVWSYQVGAGAEVKLAERVKLYGNYLYSKDTKPFFEVYSHKDYQILNKYTAFLFGIMLTVN